MGRRLAPIIAAAVFLLAPRADAGPAEQFSAANTQFREGEFEKAYVGYQEMLEAGHFNPDLFYNLGNASYRLARFGEAALWYERALAMDPTHREARQNLRFLKRTGGILQFEAGRFDDYLNMVRSDTLLAVATAAGWLAALGFAAALTLKCRRRTRAALWTISPIFALVALAAAAGFYLKRHKHGEVASRSIVTATGAKAFTAPARIASPVIDLPPGSQVARVSERGAWHYIDVPSDDVRGWVEKDAVEPIWPYDPGLAD